MVTPTPMLPPYTLQPEIFFSCNLCLHVGHTAYCGRRILGKQPHAQQWRRHKIQAVYARSPVPYTGVSFSPWKLPLPRSPLRGNPNYAGSGPGCLPSAGNSLTFPFCKCAPSKPISVLFLQRHPHIRQLFLAWRYY